MIRSATRADCAGLAALHGQFFERPWSAADFETLLGNSAHLALMAYVPEGTCAGYVLVAVMADDCEVLSLGVRPDHRRTGLATRLLVNAADAAAVRGAARIFLEVDVRNDAARGFYEHHGFAQLGVRSAYYQHADGSRSDALVLSRPIAGKWTDAHLID